MSSNRAFVSSLNAIFLPLHHHHQLHQSQAIQTKKRIKGSPKAIISAQHTNTSINMPRNGDGSSDNAIEPTNNIIHGAGEEPVSNSTIKFISYPSSQKTNVTFPDHPRCSRRQDCSPPRARAWRRYQGNERQWRFEPGSLPGSSCRTGKRIYPWSKKDLNDNLPNI